MLRTSIQAPTADYIPAGNVALLYNPLPAVKIVPPTLTAPTMQTAVMPVNSAAPVPDSLVMQASPVQPTAITMLGVPINTLTAPINTMQQPAVEGNNSLIWILAGAAVLLLLTSKKKRKK